MSSTREQPSECSGDDLSWACWRGLWHRQISNPANQREASMASSRKISLVAGLLYLLTFFSIPTLALSGPVHDPNYIVGPGPDIAVIVGGVLEIIVALAGIGTAVVLFPVLKKQNESA